MGVLELLSVVFGGLLRIIPSFFDAQEKKRDLEFEIKRMDKQIELDKLRGVQAVDEIKIQSEGRIDSSWADAVGQAIKSQSAMTGIKWVDGLSQTVRPVLTYWWCVVLYTSYKIVTVTVAVEAGASLTELAPLLLSEFDRSVVGSIIGFWFVDRAIRTDKK